jgi:hypothetical protein
LKLYARYLTPGIIMSEESVKEVEGVSDAIAMAPGNAFCFQTFRLPEVDFEYDAKRFVVKPIPQEESDRYYLGGEVFTIEQVRAQIDRLDQTGALLSNMESNGWSKVIKCRTGNFQPLEEGDQVVNPS